MKIKLITVGKLKETYLKSAVAEYSKRLGRFAKIEAISLADEKTPDRASDAENRQILEKEGQRILQKIGDRDYVIALAIEGDMLSSEKLAQKIHQLTLSGQSTLTFIIGGSLGLSPEVKRRAQLLLSFSPMTFPHQLMRVILLEQIYRAFMINEGSPYHK
ncbi:23S rRNA (pseudouridine(1915)-N(3))-methyltransferase RlmH [Streptococcus sp. DD12]|uniref:23S rRNA (pseudouridine(1915)-N(3))-methyltransferase RlmH n=1 Tax=Streptococcus sp. DD12 TaxID=1777880 RepID=UPI0008323C66|nr:23S rRNA (pseudouridine(1915)-N(3))-methyltransferase RlmH [Streptococcus sp. DD12]